MMINKEELYSTPLMRKIFLLLVVFNLISACAQKQQYEILSPCVSLETLNPHAKNPCIRRPANHHLS